ncbi:hypothetical protein [Streptomyces bottropensis]|uniref:hypothetical protein n=1 Tax=Streptomyces bottropensis TaxID=42235 RepID=UPI0036804D73
MDTNRARIAQWLDQLDPSAKQELRDLNLQEGDVLPEEFVHSLREYGIHPVQWEDPAIGHVAPGELLALL